MPENAKYILAIFGVLLVGSCALLYFYYDTLIAPLFIHQIKVVHVHSDFSFYILDQKIDLSGDKYQSTITQILSPNIHLHDNVGTMIHRHADGVTLADFLHTLGFALTNTCITTDEEKTYCTDSKHSLLLFVNGKLTEDPANYINQEGDKILLYYGDPNSPNIATYESQITNDACLYSETCPERGKPPTESCGLTCNVI